MTRHPAMALEEPKHSPNLRKWLNGRDGSRKRAQVYRDKDGALHIGEMFDGGWFHGARLMRALTVGGRATVYAFPPRSLGPLTHLPDFWKEYAAKGRCAIDPDHRMGFIGDATRWQTDGDERSCQWCGEHKQRLRRWTEPVERERWEPAIRATLPETRDGE